MLHLFKNDKSNFLSKTVKNWITYFAHVREEARRAKDKSSRYGIEIPITEYPDYKRQVKRIGEK
jgi:hypothetical protein